MGTNKLLLTGNAADTPTLTTTASGYKIARVRVATSEKIFNQERYELDIKTTWHNVVFWNDIADLAVQHINKGTRLYLEGYVKEREWVDKNGNPRTTTEVHASHFKIIKNSEQNL